MNRVARRWLRNNLRTRKAVEALVEKAKVTDGEWVDEARTAS